MKDFVGPLVKAGIQVSMFIDPDIDAVMCDWDAIIEKLFEKE